MVPWPCPGAIVPGHVTDEGNLSRIASCPCRGTESRRIAVCGPQVRRNRSDSSVSPERALPAPRPPRRRSRTYRPEIPVKSVRPERSMPFRGDASSVRHRWFRVIKS